MHNFYQHSERGKYLFFAVSIILVGIFLYISNELVKNLAQEERNKMEIWADATRELATETSDANIDLILKIIQSNTTIPVKMQILTSFRPFSIPIPIITPIPRNSNTRYLEKE